MTKEEKAKAYDEALEKEKEMMGNTCSSEQTKCICQELFPELAESEDERIRKKLIEIVSAWKNREPHGIGNVKYISSSKIDKINKILAWLEKQKEQKPAEQNPTSGNSENPNSHAEWSEEDEVKMGYICDIVLPSFETIFKKTGRFNEVDFCTDELIGLLKSLRTQPHRKPTEEQMQQLKDAACLLEFGPMVTTKKRYPALESLLDDLKKL